VTALAEVAAYVPPQRAPIESLARELDLSPMQLKVFQRYHGLAEVSRDPDRSLVDLLTSAACANSGRGSVMCSTRAACRWWRRSR
jgi:3-oxoacyl-[acyl-carrier-protein] synthase III